MESKSSLPYSSYKSPHIVLPFIGFQAANSLIVFDSLLIPQTKRASCTVFLMFMLYSIAAQSYFKAFFSIREFLSSLSTEFYKLIS